MRENLEDGERDDNIGGNGRLINARRVERAQRFYQLYAREGTMKTDATRFHDERSGECRRRRKRRLGRWERELSTEERDFFLREIWRTKREE